MNVMKKNKEDAERWSQLPTLIMWMIKDCLTSFLDSVRLASVCKNWKAACESYPFEARRQCASPWLMQRHWKSIRMGSGICEFMNVSTNEKFVLDLPELLKADILYSKHGWLLVREKPRKGRGPLLQTSIFILSLHSREKILMPDLDICYLGRVASFSCSADGTPECVVFDVFNPSSMILYTALVGDEKWTKHTYETGRRIRSGNTGLVVVKSKIYCIREAANLFIFDLTSFSWREISKEPEETNCGSWILSSEGGEILRIQRGRNLNTFAFFRLNDTETGWKELINDLDDRRWFLSIKRNNYFTEKGARGLRILHYLRLEPTRSCFASYKIDTHDMATGAITPYETNKDALWVDLGKIDRVPPSCVGYVPPRIL